MPPANGPFQPQTCPYFARFRPSGREHTYDLCAATGEEPLNPSQAELTELCHGQFEQCPHFRAAQAREAATRYDEPNQRAA